MDERAVAGGSCGVSARAQCVQQCVRRNSGVRGSDVTDALVSASDGGLRPLHQQTIIYPSLHKRWVTVLTSSKNVIATASTTGWGFSQDRALTIPSSGVQTQELLSQEVWEEEGT